MFDEALVDKKKRESILESTDMPTTRRERKGTILDIRTNDATLFNLGQTARITQVNPTNQSVRRTSVAGLNLMAF